MKAKANRHYAKNLTFCYLFECFKRGFLAVPNLSKNMHRLKVSIILTDDKKSELIRNFYYILIFIGYGQTIHLIYSMSFFLPITLVFQTAIWSNPIRSNSYCDYE